MQALKVDIADNIKIIIDSNDSNDSKDSKDSNGNSFELTLHHALEFLVKKSKMSTKPSKRGKAAVITDVLKQKEMFFSSLTKLLCRKGILAQGAIQLFGNLASPKSKVQDAIRDCGAIEALMQLLFRKDQEDTVQREILEALSNIVHDNYKNQERIRKSERIPDLVQLLQIMEVRGPAADAIRRMYERNPSNQKAFAEAGAITSFTKLLADPVVNSAGQQQDLTSHAFLQALGTVLIYSLRKIEAIKAKYLN